jgi:hypothetical protein
MAYAGGRDSVAQVRITAQFMAQSHQANGWTSRSLETFLLLFLLLLFNARIFYSLISLSPSIRRPLTGTGFEQLFTGVQYIL